MFLKKFSNLNSSLLFRLTIMYAVAFTALSSIGFLIFYYRIYAVTMDGLDSELQREAQKYAGLMEKSGLKGISEAIADDARFEDFEDGFYRLFDFNGRTLMSTDMSLWKTIAKQDRLTKIQQTGLTFDIQTLATKGQHRRARTITRIISPGYVLQIGESLHEIDVYMDVFLKLFSLLVISLIVVSTVIGWLLARWATSDMQEVTDTAEEISNGAYNRRVEVNGRLKEIKRLGVTFNSMLDRIQGLLKSMKEINDNIAHDLRSPLARIRGIAEMNLLKERSIDDYKEMAASTVEECDTLIEMINTMLDITEAEAGVNRNQYEVFELVDLVRGACELFRPIAERKKINLKTSLPDSIMLASDRKKLQRIVTNLLENAIKYTSENKSVAVSVSAQNGKIVIIVKDTGIGIAEKDLPYIFERFYRCDHSRSQGGVGLGLSLARAYTASINGTLHVKSNINQGSCFTLALSSM